MTKWGFGWYITELLNFKKLAEHVWMAALTAPET